MDPNKLKIVSLSLARIDKVFFNHSKRKNDKRMFCNIYTMEGTFYDDVPFYGGTVDKKTKNLRGIFFPPCKDQMVGLMFVKGHFESPYCAFSVPHPWESNKDRELFGTKIQEQLEDVENGGIFHSSGSKILFRKNGDVVINDDTDFAVAFNDLKAGFDQLKSDFNAFLLHVHGAAGTPPVPPALPSTASVDAAKIDAIKVP